MGDTISIRNQPKLALKESGVLPQLNLPKGASKTKVAFVYTNEGSVLSHIAIHVVQMLTGAAAMQEEEKIRWVSS